MAKNECLSEIKALLKIGIQDDELVRILFDMNKYFDKQFVDDIHEYQKKNNVVFNSIDRNKIRSFYYYNKSSLIENLSIPNFPTIKFTKNEECDVATKSLNRIKTYEPEKILNSIISKYNNLSEGKGLGDNGTKWLKYYNEKRHKESEYSVILVEVDQKQLEDNNYDISYIYEFINKTYRKLENYRHLVIVFNDELKNKNNEIITWDCIYKIGIYCENFMQFNDKFPPCHKDKQITSLTEFIKSRFKDCEAEKIASDFYKSISYGFKFEDCYIREDSKQKFLVYKKIELDNRKVPCPCCMTTIQSSNSYPEVFLHAWECKNPDCPDRSKSGRGKRFEEFGTYRFFKLAEDDPRNHIDTKLYKDWKRDIYPTGANIHEIILKEYAWADEIVGTYNISNNKNSFDRKLKEIDLSNCNSASNIVTYEQLPIVKLLKEVQKCLPKNAGNIELKDNLTVVNDDSTKYIRNLKQGQIGCAITSPPYYNAREYSQWQTLVMYLIDMMACAQAINITLDNDGTYLYNIGDIVSEDNVYVVSNMSKRRLQLGFLTCALFEIVGFKLCGNIIWDKGEVQSKRNSTINLNSGYVKCINCYEHVFIFKKQFELEKLDYVAKFIPVIKINCKGENIYKHTAPYPLDMVELIKPFLISDKYLLDPFLGSGTTLNWCKTNQIKGVGIELNKEYYNLCLDNIFSTLL